jgi:phosphoribosyl 1,2-cyclic phosphodiesterase
MQVCVLASGSGGNAIYVQHGATRVLVDAGLAGREIDARLRSIGVDVQKLMAIVVSHEHGDHMSGVGILARKVRCPVWLTRGTFDAARSKFKGRERIRFFDNDQNFSIGDLEFQPFAISHDAADPVNFVVDDGQSRLGIATDMGVVSRLAFERLSTSDMVVLESNYDREMLMAGPYPWSLKQRIQGTHGHLDNIDASETLGRLIDNGLEQVVLAHLSEENNRPDLASAASEAVIESRGLRRYQLTVAEQHRPTPTFVI